MRIRTHVNATVIVNGRVIEGTHVAESIPGDSVTARMIGMVVMQSMGAARRVGWHMADPNAYVRVECKQYTYLDD